jgi:predicted dehydrogenase
MEKIRAAVVGTGGFGQLHARFYHEYPLTELVAVVNRTESRGRRVAEQLGVPWYEKPDQLLENEDFDLVSICTREENHLEMGLLFAQAGKKILMEKPLAPTLESSIALVEAVEKTDVFMAVNYILRQDPRFLEVKSRSDNGDFGDHISYFARRRGTFAGAQYYGPWTDILISTAIHDLDLMIWYNGSIPVRVYAESVMKKCSDIGTEDAVVATLKFENGAIGCLDTSWVLPAGSLPAPIDCSFNLVGTEGGAFIDGANNGLRVCHENLYSKPDLTHWPVLPPGLSGDLFNSMKSVVDSIINDKEPFMTGREALKSHRVVFAMKESLKTGRPVNL